MEISKKTRGGVGLSKCWHFSGLLLIINKQTPIYAPNSPIPFLLLLFLLFLLLLLLPCLPPPPSPSSSSFFEIYICSGINTVIHNSFKEHLL